MQRNIGRSDALTRGLIGIVLAGLGIYFQSWWGLLAILPLVTASIGFCPLYRLIGANTCAKK